MEQRELGMDEVEARCDPLINTLSLKNIIRSPSNVVDEEYMPCVIIMEGDDNIIKYTGRSYIGYPCKRELDVIVECWDYATGGVRNIFKAVRKAVLADGGVLVSDGNTNVIIREKKAVGPFNLGVPNVLGMRVIFGMSYVDSGPAF